MVNTRKYALIASLLTFLLGLICRLFYLQIYESQHLQQAGELRSIRNLTDVAQRGVIYDRNNVPLAVSSMVKSVWVDPRLFKSSSEKSRALEHLLDLPQGSVDKTSTSHKRFIYLKRHISPSLAKQVEALQIKGVQLQTEYRRYYPQGEVFAQVLGQTSIDQRGIEGLELAYEPWLSGNDGITTYLKDRNGEAIELVAPGQHAQRGNDLFVSLDGRLQFYAFKHLMKTVQQHAAKSGTLVAVALPSGEILAQVNYPSYNPNQRLENISPYFRNRAVTDVLEPGSVIKPFTMINILESQRFSRDTLIDTRPGKLELAGKSIKDVRNFGVIDLETILKKSSNIGIVKASTTLPAASLIETLKQFGFASATQIGFPGERTGQLPNKDSMSMLDHATLSFGYGMTTTPLQLAQAYARLAMGCRYLNVSLIKNDQSLPERFCKPSVAKSVSKMLQLAVQPGGTGVRAQVAGFDVAGKTGTVRKVNENGYTNTSHYALFAGFAPAADPKIAMVVIVDAPSKGQYYGGLVAAPLFSKVMYHALRLNQIPISNRQNDLILVKK